MAYGEKIKFVRTIPETASFPEIPAGTPGFTLRPYCKEFEARFNEMRAAGQTHVRIHSKYLGYDEAHNYFWLFVPTDSIAPR